MVNRIDFGQRPDPFSQSSENASSASTGGSVRGQTIIQEKSVQSLVMGALEEVTFSAAEQLQSADVESVEVEDLSTVIAEQIKKKQQLKENLENKRPQNDPRGWAKVLASLRSQKDVDGREVLRQLGAVYGDPSDLFLALEQMQEELARERGNRELKKAAKQAADTLWEEHAPAIIAGLNALPMAQRFSRGDVDQFQALREAYRDQVQKEPTLGERLRDLRKRFGDDKLDDRIKFLIAAAGEDIGSPVTSLDPARLNQILQELFRLQMLIGTGGRARTGLARMHKRFGTQAKQSEWDLLEDFLNICADKWVGVSKFAELGERFAGRNIESQIYFLRELTGLAHEIPVKFFDDLKAREQLIDTSQGALDQAIEREEAE
ncbi:MAG: TyeA family type III secretion system gatekeeper subunit [Pseudomonadota bacterium]